MKTNPVLRGVNFLLKFLVVALMLSPFYLAFCYAFKPKEEITTSGLSFPTHLYLDNFKNAFERTNFLVPLSNTLLVTVLSTAVLTVACSMAAYAIARRKSRIYQVFGALLMLTILVPFHAYMLPLYMRLQSWGLINTLTGFSIAKIGAQVGFSVIIIKGFVKTIPIEIEEATYIDGGGVFRNFFSVVLPLMKPIIMTSVIINALDVWNEYVIGVVVLQKPDKYILSLLQYTFFGQYFVNLGQAFAIFTISMIPILVLYFIFQRFIISGVVMGGVKG